MHAHLTPPSLTWNGGPADGASYYFSSVPAAPTCTAADLLSGPNGCGVTGYGTTVGTQTMTKLDGSSLVAFFKLKSPASKLFHKVI